MSPRRPHSPLTIMNRKGIVMNLKDFRRFLDNHARDKKLLGPALRHIGAFARIVVRKTYDLSTAAQADLKEIAGAIAAVTGQPVKKIILVSAASPDPALTPGRGGFDAQTLWRGIGATLWDNLHSKHKLTLWDGFGSDSRKGHEIGNELWLRLEALIGRDIQAVFAASAIKGRLGYELSEACQKHLWYSLFYFVGFCLNGAVERIQRLAGLMKLLPRAIPLGEKRDEPGTWYVVVA